MKRKTKNSRCIDLICVALVLSLSVLGVGFASWRDGLQVVGTVATGTIDPVFTACDVVAESRSPGITSAVVVGSGNKINIQVHDAYPGYYAHLRYRLTNRGTVPVRYKTLTQSGSTGLDVRVEGPPGVIGRGEIQEGDLILTVGSVEENSESNFSVELDFRQWNAAK